MSTCCEDDNVGTPEWPITPTNFFPIDVPTSPRLEVGDIDSVPFSQKFSDLFEGLGLHAPSTAGQGGKFTSDPDISYDIESYSHMKDIDPEWSHDDIDEIVLISPKPQRHTGLETIHEDVGESSMAFTECSQQHRTLLSDFEIEDIGSPNDTKTCLKRDTGQRYIIKRRHINIKNTSWPEKKILERLSELSPPFIPYICWAFRGEEYMYIIADYHGGGNLADLITQYGPLPSHRAIFYAAELVSAISSLHNYGIVHNALEPKNIAIDDQGHIVISDFSHSRFLSDALAGCHIPRLTMNEYRAPEVFLGWKRDASADCWAFGMMMFYIFFGTQPYGFSEGVMDDHFFSDRVVGCNVPTESLRLVHPMARDLITKCLERNPSIRWNMEKVRGHGYFASIDWTRVAAKALDVPIHGQPLLGPSRRRGHGEFQDKKASVNSSFIDLAQGAQIVPPTSGLRKSHSVRGVSKNRIPPELPVMPKIFTSRTDVAIPETILEDDPTSTSASPGHFHYDAHSEIEEIPRDDPAERMTRLWAEIDREQQGSSTSMASLELGKASGIFKAPKLRKYRSAIHPHRLFSMSTSSLSITKLRKKPRSTATLRLAKHAEPIDNLPMGLHQIGSGIGFTYNVPAALPSKATLCSFTPACHPLFYRGFSTLNLGLGLGHSGNRKPSTSYNEQSTPQDQVIHINSSAPNVADTEDERVDRRPIPGQVGSGTFIRDMYECPSWILCPPDNLPSPLALVNMSTRPTPSFSHGSSCEPPTPATLVGFNECHEDGRDANSSAEVTISIPKHLELDLDFERWAPDSTLRLVPPPTVQAELSYGDNTRDLEKTMYTDKASTTNGGT